MLEMNILYPCLLIGIVTFLMSIVAMRIGIIAGHMIGKRVKALGGLILIGISVKILFSHMA